MGATKIDQLQLSVFQYSPELNVVNVTLPVAISAPGRPNAGVKLAVTPTV